MNYKESNKVLNIYLKHGDVGHKILNIKKAEYLEQVAKAKEHFNHKHEEKVLYIDIETSMMLAGVFGLYGQDINPSNIVQDWFCISVQWAWNDGPVQTISVIDDINNKENKKVKASLVDKISGIISRRDNKRLSDDKALQKISDLAGEYKSLITNDKAVIEKMHELLGKADYVVYHNGDAFDLKKFTARSLYHRLDPLPQVDSFDTLKEVRKIAKFSSHQLGYLCDHLDVNHSKGSTKMKNAWKLATTGNIEAIKDIVEYGIDDIPTLRDLYLLLRPYSKKHPNVNLIHGTTCNCPVCGSENLIKRGVRKTATSAVQRLQCNDCGKWSKSGLTIRKSSVR